MRNNYNKLRRACDIRRERRENIENILCGIFWMVLLLGSFAICVVKLLTR
jgi:hypothetical protein